MLLCWGVRHDGSEGPVDFCVAPGESEQAWTDFLTHLWELGLPRRDRWERPLEDSRLAQ